MISTMLRRRLRCVPYFQSHTSLTPSYFHWLPLHNDCIRYVIDGFPPLQVFRDWERPRWCGGRYARSLGRLLTLEEMLSMFHACTKMTILRYQPNSDSRGYPLNTVPSDSPGKEAQSRSDVVPRSAGCQIFTKSAQFILCPRSEWFPTYKLRICEIVTKISRQNHFRIRTLIFPSVQSLSESVHNHQRDIFRRRNVVACHHFACGIPELRSFFGSLWHCNQQVQLHNEHTMYRYLWPSMLIRRTVCKVRMHCKSSGYVIARATKQRNPCKSLKASWINAYYVSQCTTDASRFRYRKQCVN
jgi:hypothetical protein